MKTIDQVINRINELKESYESALEYSPEKNELYFKRQGAVWTLDELLQFITDDRHVAK